jgi:hypothetical protein
MKKPNFFIVGAAKSGTTALSEYLRAHPNVFFSTPKEPSFFSKDFPLRACSLRNLKQYLKLFKNALPQHTAIGEGSVSYLFSTCAVKEILSFNPDAKFIVMLRNPVDMFFSLYNELSYLRHETARTPKEAWQLQSIRQKNAKKIPLLCVAPQLLNYSKQCKTGTLVERLLSIVSRHKVHIIIYDDFKNDPRAVYQKTLNFLDLSDDYRKDFPKINSRKKLINPNLNKVFFILFYLSRLRHKLGLRWLTSRKLMKFIRKTNLKWCYNNPNTQKEKRDLEFVAELKAHFKDDIKKLSALLDRDLMHWVH